MKIKAWIDLKGKFLLLGGFCKILLIMARCKKCGKEMEGQREGFCSLSCYNLDLQEIINSTNKPGTLPKKNLQEFV